jgi:uncharacterized RDD family membrane protein YckC
MISNSYFRRLPTHMPQSPKLLLRRLAALSYDSLICLALSIITTLPWVMLNQGSVSGIQKPYYQVSLLLVIAGYWLSAWYYRGQTIGMRAWRLRLIGTRGQCKMTQLLARLYLAPVSLLCGGLGWWWLLYNPHANLIRSTHPHRHRAPRVVLSQSSPSHR